LKNAIRSLESHIKNSERTIALFKGYIAKGNTAYKTYLGYSHLRYRALLKNLTESKAKLAAAESDWSAKVAAEKPKYIAKLAKEEAEKKARQENYKFTMMFPKESAAVTKWKQFKRTQEYRMKSYERSIEKIKGYIAQGHKHMQKHLAYYTRLYNDTIKKVNEYAAKLATAEEVFKAKIAEAKAAGK